MPRITGHGLFWTDYRQHVVRTLLARGVDRMMVAERLGVSRVVLREAILRYGLDRPAEPELVDA